MSCSTSVRSRPTHPVLPHKHRVHPVSPHRHLGAPGIQDSRPGQAHPGAFRSPERRLLSVLASHAEIHRGQRHRPHPHPDTQRLHRVDSPQHGGGADQLGEHAGRLADPPGPAGHHPHGRGVRSEERQTGAGQDSPASQQRATSYSE